MEDSLIAELQATLGKDSVRTGDMIPSRNWADAAGLPPTAPAALILPRSSAEVSAALTLCNDHGRPVVPQGGMTGLAGGAHPLEGEIAISLERMVGIVEVDLLGGTITALAGTPLQMAQEAANDAGLLLGVDLGARGSCTVGGTVATNAGGNQVLRYGMTRANVRGMEVVLADGRIVSTPGKMLKNNTGYDWTQLFIGSEGTLGIVTQVTFALHPLPQSIDSALVKVADTAAALKLLGELGKRLPAGLLVFEAMWREFYDIATGTMGLTAPVPAGDGVFLLIEAPGTGDDGFIEALSTNLETGLVLDAVIAQSDTDRASFWSLRESVYEHGRHFPPMIGFDISIPLERMEAAVEALRHRIGETFPDVPWVVFGHLADCNLHVNVMPKQSGPETRKAVSDTVYGVVADFGGSVSAEHGIGRLKQPYLDLTRSPTEIALMADIKRMLDPGNILNPGRILAAG